MKKCKKCGLIFEAKRCKSCAAKYMREWSSKNPGKVRVISKRTYLKNKEICNERSNLWSERNRERSNEIKKSYKKRNRDKYLKQQREYANKRYEEKRDEILEKENSPERKLVLGKWREKNRERLNAEYLKRYHSSEEMKKKHSARNKVYRALKSGRLVKASECSACGLTRKLQGHHEDYSNALEVIWVCIPCHEKIHRKCFK